MRFSLHRLLGGSRLFIGALIAGSLLLSAASTASAQTVPVARKAVKCNITSVYHSLGPSYTELLYVTGVSCGYGETEVKAYNKCRLAHGGTKGTCASKVNGYTCKEQRTSSPDEFIAKVSCTKSRDIIDFTYTQFT